MVSFTNPTQRRTPDTAVVSLTAIQSVLWRLGMPVLDANAVATHKRRARSSACSGAQSAGTCWVWRLWSR